MCYNRSGGIAPEGHKEVTETALDWTAIAQESLEELGGREFYVPGAKLHAHIRSKGFLKGQDFLQQLRRDGVTFRQFVKGMGDAISIQISPPPRTDMLVGFSGAALGPTAGKRGSVRQQREALRFRRDAYGAFTRITPVPYVYDPINDRFTTEPPEDVDCVDVPALTLQALLDERKEFAENLEQESVRMALVGSIEMSANPLAAFQRAILENGLAGKWHQFSYQTVRRRIEAWAEEKNVTARDEWFSGVPDRSLSTPQEILAELARHMTDDDARNLLVPLRAVEQMFHDLPKRK